MNRNHLIDCCVDTNQISTEDCIDTRNVSLEAEIPEALYIAMKDFISANPSWDQYRVISSALANFLFQNGSGERAVTERYLNDLFALTEG